MDEGVIILVITLNVCFGALIGYNFPLRFDQSTADKNHLLSVVSAAVLLPLFLFVRGYYIPLRNNDGDPQRALTFVWIFVFFPYYLVNSDVPTQEVSAVQLTAAGDVCCPCIPAVCQVDDLYETVKAARRPQKSTVNSYDSFVNRNVM